MNEPTRFERTKELPHFVYRAYDADGGLLYVGCSFDPARRMKDHRGDRKEWVTLMTHYTVDGPHSYAMARRLEWDAIQTERPSHNGQTPEAVVERRRRHAEFDLHYQTALAHGEPWPEAARLASIACRSMELEEA